MWARRIFIVVAMALAVGLVWWGFTADEQQVLGADAGLVTVVAGAAIVAFTAFVADRRQWFR